MKSPDDYKENKKRVSSLVDGIHFSSKAEAEIYRYLKFKEANGLIKNVKIFSSVELQLDILKPEKIRYKPDFTYDDPDGNLVYVEGKYSGRGFQRWLLVKKAWKYSGPAKLEVYGWTRRGAYLYDTVVPDPRLKSFLSSEKTGSGLGAH